MNTEAKIIISFLFNRSGKNQLTESEIYLPLSIELGWFSTKEAHKFVNNALKQKLLIKKEDLLIPSFDIGKISIPIGFYPSKKIFAEEKNEIMHNKTNVIDTIVYHIIEKKNQDRKEIIEKITHIALEKNILPEVAALLIGKKYHIDIKDSFELIENKILRENEEE
ncbi:MAG: DUF2240 family protein [Thermoplasmatales archaeon]|nr:MAG: DUF2240 family protein [Thermoplasmatales archaeon]